MVQTTDTAPPFSRSHLQKSIRTTDLGTEQGKRALATATEVQCKCRNRVSCARVFPSDVLDGLGQLPG